MLNALGFYSAHDLAKYRVNARLMKRDVKAYQYVSEEVFSSDALAGLSVGVCSNYAIPYVTISNNIIQPLMLSTGHWEGTVSGNKGGTVIVADNWKTMKWIMKAYNKNVGSDKNQSSSSFPTDTINYSTYGGSKVLKIPFPNFKVNKLYGNNHRGDTAYFNKFPEMGELLTVIKASGKGKKLKTETGTYADAQNAQYWFFDSLPHYSQTELITHGLSYIVYLPYGVYFRSDYSAEEWANILAKNPTAMVLSSSDTSMEGKAVQALNLLTKTPIGVDFDAKTRLGAIAQYSTNLLNTAAIPLTNKVSTTQKVVAKVKTSDAGKMVLNTTNGAASKNNSNMTKFAPVQVVSTDKATVEDGKKYAYGLLDENLIYTIKVQVNDYLISTGKFLYTVDGKLFLECLTNPMADNIFDQYLHTGTKLLGNSVFPTTVWIRCSTNVGVCDEDGKVTAVPQCPLYNTDINLGVANLTKTAGNADATKSKIKVSFEDPSGQEVAGNTNWNIRQEFGVPITFNSETKRYVMEAVATTTTNTTTTTSENKKEEKTALPLLAMASLLIRLAKK